jgi:hypothetical protein
MPFRRTQFADLYVEAFSRRDLRWHIIVETKDEIPYDHSGLVVRVPVSLDPCYNKINQFIVKTPINADEFYTFMADDSWWNYGFWDMLIAAPKNKQIVVTNMMFPGRLHALGKEPKPTDLGFFRGDLSMLTLRGDVLKTVLFNDRLYFADGMLFEELAAKYDRSMWHFIPQAIVYKDALNKDEWYHKK